MVSTGPRDAGALRGAGQPSFAGRLQAAWLRRGAPLALAMLPVAALYAGLAACHRWLYRSGLRRAERMPVPVIVVGNVVAGGAGKTPVVVALVEWLSAQGWQPGVVSRGHGRQGDDVCEVRPDSDPRTVGDEPLQVAQRTGVPVFVGSRRADAARALLARHPGTRVLVCDDGLQHLALARDIELCVFDDRGIGNGWPLPAGPLREPWPRPVDFVLHTGGALLPGLERVPAFTLRRTLEPVARRADGSRQALAGLGRDRPVVAVAGIARPEAFFRMLADAGCAPAQALARPDHDSFDPPPPLPPDATIVCTEKDAVKLWRTHPSAWAVGLHLSIEPAFWRALEQRLRPRLSSADGSQTA